MWIQWKTIINCACFFSFFFLLPNINFKNWRLAFQEKKLPHTKTLFILDDFFSFFFLANYKFHNSSLTSQDKKIPYIIQPVNVLWIQNKNLLYSRWFFFHLGLGFFFFVKYKFQNSRLTYTGTSKNKISYKYNST